MLKVLVPVKEMLEVPVLVLLADVLEVEVCRCTGNGSDCALKVVVLELFMLELLVDVLDMLVLLVEM